MPLMQTLNEWGEERKQLLLSAVNLLINSPSAHELMSALEAAYSVARIHPVKLSGEAAALNPLLDLRVSDEQTYNNVLGLIETKRREIGYDPLVRPKIDKFDKTEYMRAFMDRKRERQRRAAAIENMLRPDKDALRGRSRLDFMDRQSANWKKELDALLERSRQAHGGRLSKEQIEMIRDQFWSGVDEYLDKLEAEARSERMKSPQLRTQLSASLVQLDAALRHDPYKARAAL